MKKNDFIGKGWSFPPTFERSQSTVHISANEKDINESLEILFTTQPGERVLLSEFGCDLTPLVFESLNSTLITKMQHQITQTVEIFEPRIFVDNIQFDSSQYSEGILSIHLMYRIRSTNSRFNFVFPYYINEGTFVKT